jgi:hypothetical protein
MPYVIPNEEGIVTPKESISFSMYDRGIKMLHNGVLSGGWPNSLVRLTCQDPAFSAQSAALCVDSIVEFGVSDELLISIVLGFSNAQIYY